MEGVGEGETPMVAPGDIELEGVMKGVAVRDGVDVGVGDGDEKLDTVTLDDSELEGVRKGVTVRDGVDVGLGVALAGFVCAEAATASAARASTREHGGMVL